MQGPIAAVRRSGRGAQAPCCRHRRLEDAVLGTAPAGMRSGDHPGLGIGHEDGRAVGRGDAEHEPRVRVASASASGGWCGSKAASTVRQRVPCTCRAISSGASATPKASTTRRRFSSASCVLSALRNDTLRLAKGPWLTPPCRPKKPWRIPGHARSAEAPRSSSQHLLRHEARWRERPSADRQHLEELAHRVRRGQPPMAELQPLGRGR